MVGLGGTTTISFVNLFIFLETRIASLYGVLLPWPLPEVAPITLLPKSEPLVVAAVFSEALEAWLPGTLTKAEFAFCCLYLLLLFVLGY